MSNYIDAIVRYYPGIEVSVSGNIEDYNNLVLQKGESLPLKSELDQRVKEIRQEVAWRLIQSERDRRRAAGVKVGTKWFHSDDTSRIQHLGLLAMGAGMPAGIMWKTMDDSFVEMTSVLAQQIFGAVMQLDMQVFGVAEQKRQSMMQLEDPRAFEWTTGWPAIFGE